MFPETSQSAQCIHPPVIYEVPESRLSLSFLSFLAHSPIPTALVSLVLSIFIVLSVAPDFRLLALAELYSLFSQISSQ